MPFSDRIVKEREMAQRGHLLKKILRKKQGNRSENDILAQMGVVIRLSRARVGDRTCSFLSCIQRLSKVLVNLFLSWS